ncbi:MAG: hypothetical protein EHM58_07020 [Ignavibacteriae bacterium]|nr:MAG: hypothetical protein EHM58_07020 [Ignavibacteriota bacterium]
MAKTKTAVKKDMPKASLKKEAAKNYKIDFIPEKYQTPVFLGLVLILILIFFNSGLFGGKVFSSADNIASASFDTYLKDAKAQGIFPLWIPYIFAGMPSFAALVPHLERMYDISHAVWVMIRDGIYAVGGNNPVWAVVLFYVIFAFSFYFLAEYKFKNKLIALYCAIAAVFITPIIQMIIVGHNSKMIAVMMFPLVFLFTEKIFDYFSFEKEKRNIFKLLLYFGSLVFFLHVQMSSNHIQMLFNLYFLLGLYLLYRLVYSLIKKANIDVSLKTIGVFALAIGLSAMMYADSYLSIRDYNKYSIRGVPAITNQLPENQNKPKQNEPLDYDYATNWSFSPVEVMTFFVPYWVGFGDVEYKGQQMNTYWGQMPFTTSPMYFGIITMLLAVIGIWYNFKKSVVVQSLTVISIIALIISFGRTLPVLFDLMFYNFPYFSSFRAPVMIHIIINIAFVIIAGYGIKSIIEISKDKNASARFIAASKYIFPILALPIIISIIGFSGYYTSSVASSTLLQKLQQQGATQQQIQQYVVQVTQIAYDNVKSEMLVIGFLLLIAYGAAYLFVKEKIKLQFFLVAFIIIAVIDLWHIDFKTLHWDNKANLENIYKTPDYVNYVLQNEKDLNSFRIMNIEGGQPKRENTFAYWRLQSLYGYQGAKMRIYQDVDDVVGVANPKVWDVSSTKYIFSDQLYGDSIFTLVYQNNLKPGAGAKYVLKNNNVLPKAFLAPSYQVLGGFDILNNFKLGNFDAKKVVFLEKEPGVKIDTPDSTAAAEVTGYALHDITVNVNASGNNLLYLSETYYPSGWNAYIDGQPTEIFKTNYLFRSIVVPKGKHSVEFKFEPESYYTGKKLAIGANILLILIFGAAIGGIYLKKKKPAEVKE